MPFTSKVKLMIIKFKSEQDPANCAIRLELTPTYLSLATIRQRLFLRLDSGVMITFLILFFFFIFHVYIMQY